MDSELSILKARGLSPIPKQTKPSPPEATAAGRRYRAAEKEFDELIVKIQSYDERSHDVDVATGLLQLLESGARLAARVRARAKELAAYPDSFMTIDSQAAYFGKIAGAAEEAYQGRIYELDRLEAAFGKDLRSTSRDYKLIDLSLHEGFKGGHLKSKHFAQSMEDFKKRWLEGEADEEQPILSSFVGDEDLLHEVVSRAIHLGRERIERATEGETIYIPIKELRDIGFTKERGKPPRMAKAGHLIVFKDLTHPDGFRIHSAELFLPRKTVI